LLDGEERRELDISRVKLDLDDRAFQHLIPDEPEIFDSEGGTVIIRIGIAEGLEEFGRLRDHPFCV